MSDSSNVFQSFFLHRYELPSGCCYISPLIAEEIITGLVENFWQGKVKHAESQMRAMEGKKQWLF